MQTVTFPCPVESKADYIFFEETSLLGPPLIDKYTHYLLIDAFHRCELFKLPVIKYSYEEIASGLGLAPQYGRLLSALLDILVRAGFLQVVGEEWITTSLVNDTSILKEIAELKGSRGESLTDNGAIKNYMAAYLRLLDTCIADYPALLSGQKQYMEVMFPRGDISLVSAIYKGNLQSFYNNMVADFISEATQEILQKQENCHILEIGAGTGGATVGILKKLASFAGNVHYYFTDIAGGFTRMASRQFNNYTFITYKVLDINKDPLSQGFSKEQFNIVVCNNILHATTSVERSIFHAKELMQQGGILLINDLTSRNDFNTCTFGLMKDWWNFIDDDLRIPHSPLLNPRSWNEVLSNAGFGVQTLQPDPPLPLQENYQSIFIAEKI